MPSPFPGMDPYLEDPGLWPDVHHRLISITSDQIAELVRPKYLVRIEERVYISDENDPGRKVIVPDVHITARSGWENRPFEAAPVGEAVATAEPLLVTTMIRDEIREARLEIIDREQRQVVTVIEVLSPTNKVPGSRGRASYEQKRHEVLASPSHLVEIDLLRDGIGIAVPEKVPPFEYLVHVSRVARRPSGWVWPIRLSQRLPVIPVPLKAGDPDVPLDLQVVLATAYDRAGYDLSLDYRREPVPPLSPEWAAWSDRLLRERGVRPG